MSTTPHPEGAGDWSDPRTRLRRGPTPAELAAERRVAPTDAGAADVSGDAALGALLGSLPPAPRTSSNFTARVLAEVRRTEASRLAADGGRSWFHPFRWVRGVVLAGAAGLAVIVAVGWNRARVQERGRLARTVLEVSRAASAPEVPPASFGDFDAVRSLNVSSGPDDDALVAALLRP